MTNEKKENVKKAAEHVSNYLDDYCKKLQFDMESIIEVHKTLGFSFLMVSASMKAIISAITDMEKNTNQSKH